MVRNAFARQKCARLAHGSSRVSSCLSHLKIATAIDFARFQNHVADKAVANHDLDRIFKQIAAFDVAAKIERLSLEHLENFLRQLGAFHVFFADRHQTDRRIFVAEHVARIDRAHDGVLQQDARGARRCLRPASINTKTFVSVGMTAAIPGRSMPGSVRNLIVLAATAAPV